jgi:hypothetical protein
MGFCEGKLLYGPKGNNGFGYDPLFYTDVFERSFAKYLRVPGIVTEMDPSVNPSCQFYRISYAGPVTVRIAYNP